MTATTARVIANYSYRDEAGKLLYVVERREPKDFRQKKPDPSTPGGWTWKLNGVRRVPYRLPELIAAEMTEWVFVVEGEKDADRLVSLGLVATTNAGGAQNWHTLETGTVQRAFKDRAVIILPDNDDKGRKHTEQVSASVGPVAAEVRILALPGLPEKGDVSDWLDAGGTVEQLLKLAGAARPWHAPLPPKTPTGWEVIRDYFRTRFGDGYRTGDAVYCNRERREVRRQEACAALPPDLIEPLGKATNVPRLQGQDNQPGEVNVDALPGFFKKWAGTGWVAFVAELPDEDGAEPGAVEIAADELRRLVREAMCVEVTLGTMVRGHSQIEQVERRSMIEWCDRFAKPGPWRAIRSKKCWCKRKPAPTEREIGELMIAIRHELFGQLKADRRLIEMGPNRFSRRAERYAVGKPDPNERPHGERAVVLSASFIADLLADLPEPTEEEELSRGEI